MDKKWDELFNEWSAAGEDDEAARQKRRSAARVLLATFHILVEVLQEVRGPFDPFDKPLQLVATFIRAAVIQPFRLGKQ